MLQGVVAGCDPHCMSRRQVGRHWWLVSTRCWITCRLVRVHTHTPTLWLHPIRWWWC